MSHTTTCTAKHVTFLSRWYNWHLKGYRDGRAAFLLRKGPLADRIDFHASVLSSFLYIVRTLKGYNNHMHHTHNTHPSQVHKHIHVHKRKHAHAQKHTHLHIQM